MSIRDLLDTVLFKKTDQVLVQTFRYGLVSVLSLAVDFGGLYAFTSLLHLHYLLSAVIAYSIGMGVNYLLSVTWVFHSRKYQNRAMEFSIFAVIGVLGMGLNELVLWLGTDYLRLHYLVSRAVSAVIGFVWKYVIRKLVLFRPPEGSNP